MEKTRPIHERVRDLVEDAKLDYSVIAKKTGWSEQGAFNIGWTVGFIRKDARVYFFALNVETEHPGDSFPASRNAIAKSILGDLGLIHPEQK